MLSKHEFENLIQNQPTVFILGAGLSTASGISDFKSLQNNFDTTELLSTEAYENNYWKQHDFMAKNLMVESHPNPAHVWLAKLSQQSNIKLISQNIDLLLEKAGVNPDHLLKIHGTLDHFSDRNHQPVQLTEEEYKKMTPETGDHNKVRPDIVFYGEQVKNFSKAISWVDQAIIVVVIGTRLNVFPVSELALSGSNMEKLIIINTDHLAINGSDKVTVDQINEPIVTWLNNE
ncbi:SIR2 family NAD-dependent protein deacylase [Xylocopilactobacillus apis]|uniref:protein acetyllysine N-acetyltransferase n=1 Tax=Xylocopilactobacillus apis TaxID=2932183 RepID=A0AAU9DL32_9LACO|nr:Sir2 family NAD-dependent protein deacetylase [Xylocopilactobacillus apis]BDR56269.1 NAD-dependent protein deacylase [Xylocopilactobacillus apis]